MAAKKSGSSKSSGRTTIKAPGKKPVSFSAGGLHRTTGTPAGETIPAAKMAKAKAGGYGPLGVKQANLATGLLAKGRKNAAKNRAKKAGGKK